LLKGLAVPIGPEAGAQARFRLWGGSKGAQEGEAYLIWGFIGARL